MVDAGGAAVACPVLAAALRATRAHLVDLNPWLGVCDAKLLIPPGSVLAAPSTSVCGVASAVRDGDTCLALGLRWWRNQGSGPVAYLAALNA
eukprot:SM008845S23883  [mRNA]  locus=s8845:53:603:- [translate_table: standard]